MFNAAQMLQIALGLFTTKAHPVTVEAPKKERKISYGEGLRTHYAKKRLIALNAKKAH